MNAATLLARNDLASATSDCASATRERAWDRHRHDTLLRPGAEAACLKRLTRHEGASASTRIECDELPLPREPDDREHVAADAGHVRFGHAQHRGCGDGGVDGVTALAQHLEASRGGEWLARCDRALRGIDGGSAGQGRGSLGLERERGGEKRGECAGGSDRAESGHPDSGGVA